MRRGAKQKFAVLILFFIATQVAADLDHLVGELERDIHSLTGTRRVNELNLEQENGDGSDLGSSESVSSSSTSTYGEDLTISSLSEPIHSSSTDQAQSSYSSRMISSGVSSTQSVTSGTSLSYPNQKAGSAIASEATSIVGGSAVAALLAYRNWQKHSKALKDSKSQAINVRLQKVHVREEDKDVVITEIVEYNTGESLDDLIRFCSKTFTKRLESFPEFKSVSIFGGNLFRLIPSGTPAVVDNERVPRYKSVDSLTVPVTDIDDIVPYAEYLFVPSDVSPHDSEICVAIDRPCPRGVNYDELEGICEGPKPKTDKVKTSVRYSVGDRAIDVEIPDFEHWLKHKRVPIRKLGGEEQTIRIADERTLTYCDLTFTVPEHVTNVNYRHPEMIEVIFFKYRPQPHEVKELWPDDLEKNSYKTYYHFKNEEEMPVNY